MKLIRFISVIVVAISAVALVAAFAAAALCAVYFSALAAGLSPRDATGLSLAAAVLFALIVLGLDTIHNGGR